MNTTKVDNWRRKLTKGQLIHLMEAGVCDWGGLIRTVKFQQRIRDKGDLDPCFECKLIAKKLGIIT